MNDILDWLNIIPLSRARKNLARDFSDAQIIKYYFPKLIEIHNYPVTNTVSQKVINWTTLNKKVLKKIGCPISPSQIESLANSKPDQIIIVLEQLKIAITNYQQNQVKQQFQSNDNSQYSNEQTEIKQRSRPPPLPLDTLGTDSSFMSGDMEYFREEIVDLQETIRILELKIEKQSQLIAIKDENIKRLQMHIHHLSSQTPQSGMTQPPETQFNQQYPPPHSQNSEKFKNKIPKKFNFQKN